MVFDHWQVDIKTYVKNTVLFPGNIVEGYVEVTAKKNIEFTAVRLKLTGKEKVHIERDEFTGEVDENGHQEKETKNYYESNVVYKQLVTLAGSLKCSGHSHTQVMPAGTWTYPFAFQLPMDLPPSFSQRNHREDWADCMYYIKAYVDIPMGRDASHKTHFTVLKPMPVSQWSNAAPVSVDRDFDVTCCCCIGKGKVSARMYMDRTVISMDRDNLIVCVAVDNTEGEEPVESIEFSLNNHLEYSAEHITEHKRARVGHKYIKQEIPPGEKGTIQGVIELPREITPTLKTWNVKSDYTVALELNIPNASDPCHTFPVVVAQAVDNNNFSPPVVYDNCSYGALPKGTHQEFAYVPPPQPVFGYTPIPGPQMVGGPSIDYGYAQKDQYIPLPAAGTGWKPPTAYNDGRETYNTQVAWNSGVPQSHQNSEPFNNAATSV